MSQQMIVATTQKENKNVLLLCKKEDISHTPFQFAIWFASFHSKWLRIVFAILR